ncbi:alpha/beta fold hydrolase [Smaragdicoccus niigatensis]
MWATELIIRTANIEASHAKKLRADARANRGRDITRICAAYLDYLESDDPAGRLVATGVPTWVVHAEKNSDGGLTDAERRTLAAAPQITLVTIPGSVFLLPNEVPDQVAAVIADAVRFLDANG